MSKNILSLIALYLVINVYGNIKYCDNTGYYWKDYIERAPKDALPCGRDEYKKPIFIGQILKESYLIPGKIYKNYPAIYVEVADEEQEVRARNVPTLIVHFKILCSAHPEYFEWIQTNSSDLLHIKDRHLVIGGYNPDCHTFIGRKKIGKELLPGKILTYNNPKKFGLVLCPNEKCKVFYSYEVLAYHPAGKK